MVASQHAVSTDWTDRQPDRGGGGHGLDRRVRRQGERRAQLGPGTSRPPSPVGPCVSALGLSLLLAACGGAADTPTSTRSESASAPKPATSPSSARPSGGLRLRVAYASTNG